MKITAFFTNGGTPATGLSATIDGWEIGGAQVITAQAMSEQAYGWYYYEFVGYDETKDYVFRCDGSATLSGYDRYTSGTNRDDLEMATKLPTNYLMGSSVAGDKDTVIDAIDGKTTNLPTDPADQSQVESAITSAVSPLATESNATTNTTNIQTNIDANETKIDNIISDTDRLRYRGSVWIDDTAANTNTVLGTDGVPENPVSTIAAALTIATALNVQNLSLMNNTAISLSQSFDNWVIKGYGHRNIVTLNSQSVGNAQIYNCEVTGTQGGTVCVLLFECYLDSILDLECCAIGCRLIGNVTLKASNGMFFFDQCASAVPGNNTPKLTFSAGTTAVSFRHYSGGLEIRGMTADHVMSYETDGQIIINADCTGGALTLRGNMSITDYSGGAVTITQDAALNRSVLALEANATTNTTNIQTNIDANETKIDTAITDIGNLNDFDPTSEEVDIGEVKGVAVAGVNDFKADVSGLALETTAQAIKTKTDNLPADTETLMNDIAGLLGKHEYIDNYSFDGAKQMLTCRIRIYDSKGNAESHGAGGLISTFTVTSIWDVNDLQSYMVVKE